MLRIFCLVAILVSPLLSANQRLYLTDGTYHNVREYSVLSDRVRFYSVERSQWEEIPLDLIDLGRTRAENAEEQADRAQEQKMIDAEEAVERRLREEAEGIPLDAGVYLYEGGKLRSLPIAELEVVNDKKRSILKAINPLPMTAGRNFVTIKGSQSPNTISQKQPEFYIRLHRYQKFGFFKLEDRKGDRLIQTWEILPVTNQIIESQSEIEDFRREAGQMLYQIWPRTALEPGEYALVTYAPGEANIRAWDFRILAKEPAGQK